MPAAVQGTTPEDVLSSCGCSLTLTLTTSIGIWRSAGATRSWLHSPGRSKSFALARKVSPQPKFSIRMLREALRDSSQIRIGGNKKTNPDERNGMLWLPVNVSSSNLSLFFAFPLHSNVESGRCWLVVQNWRIPRQNGNLLEELSSWIEESIFPCKMTWLGPLMVIICSDFCPYCLFCCTSLSLFHSPRHDSRRRSLLMLVLFHSNTHHLSRYMVGCGSHEVLIAVARGIEVFCRDRK